MFTLSPTHLLPLLCVFLVVRPTRGHFNVEPRSPSPICPISNDFTAFITLTADPAALPSAGQLSLLTQSINLFEIIFVAPITMLSIYENAWSALVPPEDFDFDVSFRPSNHEGNHYPSKLHGIVAEVSTPWVVLLNDLSLGLEYAWTYLSITSRNNFSLVDSGYAFAARSCSTPSIRGLVHNTSQSSEQLHSTDTEDHTLDLTPPTKKDSASDTRSTVSLLPTRDLLGSIAPLLCTLQRQDAQLYTLVYDTSDVVQPSLRLSQHVFHFNKNCSIVYHMYSHSDVDIVIGLVYHWIEQLLFPPEIILSLADDELATQVLSGSKKSLHIQAAIHVRIPATDLAFGQWMTALSSAEWKNWHVPKLDITIITNDRPASFARLLTSLKNARYFGDTVNLQIHMEQTADSATMQKADSFQWPHGSVSIRRRVVHAGLLPAVVESWYPHGNHSYGLILEDDIELSPLFYAWLKMCLLRYRHGELKNRSSKLFGVSLYQQRHNELPPDGRKPFNATAIFETRGVADPSSPYLSQVPCSWGGVYFPEHWRQFHDYLAFRLSESSIKLTTNVVSNVRSNKWTRSWKRFFIEFAYLHGLVMLYPNYKDFVSFSTNHLEVGSHVKVRTKEKQDLFSVPLMKASEVERMLDFDNNTLPSWPLLPVMNLTGDLTTLKEVEIQGARKGRELCSTANAGICL